MLSCKFIVKMQRRFEDRGLMDWTKEQPISVLQLDQADRIVLKIAGEC